MADWYIKRGERVIGPISVARLEKMALGGKVRPNDLVRKDDGPYRNADQYTGLIPEFDDEYDEAEEEELGRASQNRRRRRNRQESIAPVNVHSMTRGPAFVFYFLCTGWILFLGYCLVNNILMPEGMWVDDQVDRVRQHVGNIGMSAMIFANIMILLGAVCLHIRRYYWLAMLGAVLSMIPVATPACCVGMPVGLWAIVVLTNLEVKNDFYRA